MGQKLSEQWAESQKGVATFGKIKCPRNYVLKPGHQPFKVIPNPLAKNISQSNINWLNKQHGFNLKRYTYARDRFGNKIQDFRSYYQPSVSKAYVIEHIYDPKNPICTLQCKGRCLRGLGTVATKTIGRLNG